MRMCIIGQENEGPIIENGPALFAIHLINIHKAILSEPGEQMSDSVAHKVL